jgi:hypothetical protein
MELTFLQLATPISLTFYAATTLASLTPGFRNPTPLSLGSVSLERLEEDIDSHVMVGGVRVVGGVVGKGRTVVVPIGGVCAGEMDWNRRGEGKEEGYKCTCRGKNSLRNISDVQ